MLRPLGTQDDRASPFFRFIPFSALIAARARLNLRGFSLFTPPIYHRYYTLYYVLASAGQLSSYLPQC